MSLSHKTPILPRQSAERGASACKREDGGAFSKTRRSSGRGSKFPTARRALPAFPRTVAEPVGLRQLRIPMLTPGIDNPTLPIDVSAPIKRNHVDA